MCRVNSVGDIRVVVGDRRQAGVPGSDTGGIVQTATAAGSVGGTTQTMLLGRPT